MVLRSSSGLGLVSPFDSATFGNTLSLRVDGDIGAMSLAPNGRDAALAGRRGLYVIDLDDPFSEPRWLHHVTSWEVADVQWSPHSSKPSWCVSTSNQKAMVWNLARSSQNAIEHVLHGHVRAVTDINFHPKDPELLALCSVDTFVSVWDLRTPRRPVTQFADWRAGATQVKWNFINPYTLASSHDNYFYIWDTRAGAVPLHKIDAHTRRINGLDFGRLYESEIISCSHDLSVKFWDYNKSTEVPTYTMNTDFPVNRARHLPFGESTCGVMPTAGGNNSIYIVNYKDQQGVSKMKPSYVFKGHSEPVKDFLWRQRHTPDVDIDDREFQLVTWSKDCDLRLWPIAEDFYEKAGFERNGPLPAGTKSEGYHYATFRDEPDTVASGHGDADDADDEILQAIAANASSVGHLVSYKGAAGGATTANASNQLNWISGVRIGRSAVLAASSSRNIFESADNGSTQIANFGEEVSLVGHKFPKIRFEKISVSTGNLILSLMGPWSSETSEEHKDDLVFLRIEAHFPKEYPVSTTAPVFKIEENHELSKDRKQELLRGLKEIITHFTDRDRFCLEPCLRYLMGEKVDLSTGFDDDALMLDPFEIPREDDADGGEFGYSDSSDVTMATSSDSDEELIAADAHVGSGNFGDRPDHGFDSTPVPKGCGAIWTPSGHLVCFFIPETEKPKATLLKFDQQGFGLTGALARTRKTAEKSKKLSRLEDSDDSDSDSSLSDESFSNDWDDILQNDVPRISKFLRNNIGIKQYGFGHKPSTNTNELSVPTAMSAATHSSKGGNRSVVRNVVRIHDFRHLVPAKMELAFEYRILGDSPENLARHNSVVARKYGYGDVADCWQLLAVILTKDVEVEDSDVLAPSINMFFRGTAHEAASVHKFRFYWGSHPFGGRWIVDRLMEYYERKQDIQMLAMLSCILFENREHRMDTTMAIHVPYKKEARSHSRNTVAFSFSDGSPSTPFGPAKMVPKRMSSIASSLGSSFDARSFKSASPDRYNSYFKKQIQSPMALHRESTTDTPGASSVRTSYFHTPSTGGPRDDRHQSVQSISSVSQFTRIASQVSISQMPQKPHLREIPEVKLDVCNEEALDLYDDVYSMSMLQAVDQFKLKRYREEYASILYAWGLHASRVKVLKFNFPSNSNSPSPRGSEFDVHRAAIAYSDPSSGSVDPDDPLYVTKASKGSRSTVCNYCGLLVNKRLFVCSKCAHILHAQCASDWWTNCEENECPSGCGCHCLEHNMLI